jgi:type IV pilus assembly protein PilX
MLFSTTKNLTRIRQRGLALIMSLVILLILTLLGVTSMNTSNLQTLMTGNSQYQTTALNTAEIAINTAQTVVAGSVGIIGATAPTGYYDSTTTPIDISAFNWDTSAVATVGDSKYIIEFVGTQELNSASKAWRQDAGIVGDDVSVFRITARTPSSRGAVRYVQAIYVTVSAPSFV